MSFVDFSAFPTQKTLPRDDLFWRRGNLQPLPNQPGGALHLFYFEPSFYGAADIWMSNPSSGTWGVTFQITSQVDVTKLNVFRFDFKMGGTSSGRSFTASCGTVTYTRTSSYLTGPPILLDIAALSGLQTVSFSMVSRASCVYAVSKIRLY